MVVVEHRVIIAERPTYFRHRAFNPLGGLAGKALLELLRM